MSNESSSSGSLKAQWAQWQTRWNALPARDRQLLQLAGSLLVVVLVVMVGLRPAWRTLQAAPAQLQALDAQLAQMRREADESMGLRRMPAVPPVQAEAGLTSATEFLGEAARLSVQGDRATVTFTKAEGGSVIDWLSQVRVVARARPLEANLQQDTPGHYSGTVVLALSPGSAAVR